ncbi:MAG: L-seryl-tRNA(Sec) selenium transferase, partial [Chloroflexi bacterium]|nr:L-seryl-tRNA(Sec) selenium transferase [Chloroflexota bacterium]
VARSASELAGEALAGLERLDEGTPVPTVINATGVLIHTNLGRATWPVAAIRAAVAAAGGPLLLELDPESGRRGRRYRAAEDALIALTGAEDALVTNNNAAAVALAVGLVGRGGGVVVSRGELVEIGGGVRIPEIVRRAGARLIEVGTTNRTRAEDYADAFAGESATTRPKAVLRVHRSNFTQEGFVEVADLASVATLAHEHGAIVIDDLGSGALLDTARFGLPHEPQPAERLADGADLVTFSGDKLVGGPQAGLVVGRADLIARIRKDPLARAMRPDKVTLAAVAATLNLYRASRAATEIPVWRAVATSLPALQARAATIATAVDGVAVPTEATFGGGALPGVTVPSFGVALIAGKPDALAAALRTGAPAVIGRIEDGRVILDLRTVEPDRDHDLETAVVAAAVHAGTATGG